jgi:hypothetical protein
MLVVRLEDGTTSFALRTNASTHFFLWKTMS